MRASAERQLGVLASVNGSTVAAPGLSRGVLAALEAAQRAASQARDDFVSTEHLVVGLASDRALQLPRAEDLVTAFAHSARREPAGDLG